MNKAILVLDEMPETCEKCRLSFPVKENWYCDALLLKISEGKPFERVSKCPLKPMPEPFIPEPAYYTDEESFQVGYNTALDDAEGKNDE